VLYTTKLERLVWYKYSSLLGLFISYKENEVLWIWPLGPYSQHFIFIVTYEQTLKARVLYTTKLERLGGYKHSSLLDLFVSYEENEVLWIQPLGPYSQHFIFIVTYEQV
jgi:hypothetical protein